MITSIKGSIWKSRVNSFIGILFIGTCALWASNVIIETAYGESPIVKAFAAVIERETTVPSDYNFSSL